MGKFGGFPGGMGNMQNLMRQAQKMQAEMQKKQEEAANTEFETSAGGGAVVDGLPLRLCYGSAGCHHVVDACC